MGTCWTQCDHYPDSEEAFVKFVTKNINNKTKKVKEDRSSVKLILL